MILHQIIHVFEPSSSHGPPQSAHLIHLLELDRPEELLTQLELIVKVKLLHPIEVWTFLPIR